MPNLTQSVEDPFSYATEDDPRIQSLVIRLVERLTGAKRLKSIYKDVVEADLESTRVWACLLEELGITYSFDQQALDAIPREGPLVVIANHPFGVVDGAILGDLMLRTRPDAKMIINQVLYRLDSRLHQHLLPVDFSETREAQRTNVESRRQALSHLAVGGAIMVFPAGGVATAPGVFGAAEDLDWNVFCATLIQKSGAVVVPAYFPGQNSLLFHAASRISFTLRLGMLINEVRNKMGQSFSIHIGRPIEPVTLSNYTDRRQLLDYLREQTFALSSLEDG